MLLSDFLCEGHIGLEINSEIFISSLQFFPRFHDRLLRDCWYISRKNWYRGKAGFVFSPPLFLLCLFEKKKSNYCSTQALLLNANWYWIRSRWLLHDNLIDCWIVYYFLMVEAMVVFLNDQRQAWIQMTNFYDRLSLFLQQKLMRWNLVLVATFLCLCYIFWALEFVWELLVREVDSVLAAVYTSGDTTAINY